MIPTINLSRFCLYPITCLNRDQSGCHNLALNAQLRQLPVHDIARRTCFITGSQLLCWTKLLDHLADRLDTVRNRTQAPYLAIRLSNCYGDCLGMDIQTQKS